MDPAPARYAIRISGHLGCELTAIVLVAERFPTWEHVNVQRGVDAYLSTQPDNPQWFGVPGSGRRPHEDIVSLITSPAAQFGMFRGPGARSLRGVAAATMPKVTTSVFSSGPTAVVP